ncbi:rhodanese-like domain-containing protein [Pseudomonas sp. J452]|uniref:rhodanese-like domain-containing protein n=1 Tax=Pseudomonas sp. J452 TaxID=2898441 RepID=UPI0021ADA825|nr:rhodanese-like domain-containing protein [Pseudomonas sp. J452]UUY07093.1 rhodanese-like domain-containing protein [Pseudomonas sp. J452]
MRHLLLSLALILPIAQAGEVDQSAALRTLILPDTILIDVRSADEFASGSLPGAQLIPHDQIGTRIAAVVPDKNTPVVLYCRSGRRSSQAQDELRALGYTQVMNAGGYEQFKLATTPRDKEAACIDC